MTRAWHALSNVFTSCPHLTVIIYTLGTQLPRTNAFYYDHVYMFQMYGKGKDAEKTFLPVMNALATLRVRSGKVLPYPIRALGNGADGELEAEAEAAAAAAAEALVVSLQGVMDELKNHMDGLNMLVCSCGQ